jgi:hypothetical protein
VQHRTPANEGAEKERPFIAQKKPAGRADLLLDTSVEGKKPASIGRNLQRSSVRRRGQSADNPPFQSFCVARPELTGLLGRLASRDARIEAVLAEIRMMISLITPAA